MSQQMEGHIKTNLEVVDERLHALFHCCSGWRNELVVVDLDNSSRHLVQTLWAGRSQCTRKYMLS